MRSGKTEFQVRLDQTKISWIAVETMDADDEMGTFRREQPILVADVEVRHGRGQGRIITKRHIRS